MTALNQLNQLALLQDIAQIDDTISAFESAYGYDPSFQYCLFTGKPIGIVNATEFGELIGLLPEHDKLNNLRTRVLASMRPSMKWNRDALDSLPIMRKAHPVETMAYLLNQLFMVPKGEREDVLQGHESRIYLFAKLEEWHYTYGRSLGTVSNSPWDSVLHMLLELNVKFTLKNERAPFALSEFMDLPIESFLVILMERLRPWHSKRVEFHARQEAQAIYHSMNPGSKKAYFDSFMDQRPELVKAVSKAKVEAKAKKRTEMSMFADIFDSIIALDPSILDERAPATAKPASSPAPIRKAATFGALLKPKV